MNVVTLHLLSSAPSADFGQLRLAAPAMDPSARVLLWEGLPPTPVPEHPNVAPVVLQGDVDGRRAYAERVPRGLSLAEVSDLGRPILTVIAHALVEALRALHETDQVHGLVIAERIWLGIDGDVVLTGRGRRGGDAALDVRGACTVLGEAGLPVPETGSLAVLVHALPAAPPEGVREDLALKVRTQSPTEGTLLGQLHLQVGPSPDALDEVVPDLGPDEGHGLLDRWAVTTFHGRTTTGSGGRDETTDAGIGPGSPLALTLWTTLAGPNRHPPPPDRFREVEGEPSRGLRALLLEEAPDSLPALLGGEIEPFLLDDIDSELPVDADAPRYEFTDPEVTPAVLDDEDGDTAIYDVGRWRRAQALRQGDAADEPLLDDPTEATRPAHDLALLEARIAEAERRAADAERRAVEAERRAGRGVNGPETGILERFLRIEVVVALLLGALVVWLLVRTFG